MTIEQLRNNIKWWESKRWIYALLILCFSVLGLYMGTSKTENYSFSFDDVICLSIWLLVANIFYSVGLLLELFDWYYFKGKLKLIRFKHLFFIFGLLFSCVYSFINYFMLIAWSFW